MDQPLWVRWAVNEAASPPLIRNVTREMFPCFSVFTGYGAKRLPILYPEVKMNSHTRSPNPLNEVQKLAIYTRLEFITLWYSLTGLWTGKTNPNGGTSFKCGRKLESRGLKYKDKCITEACSPGPEVCRQRGHPWL